MTRTRKKSLIPDAVLVLCALVVYGTPFLFILNNSLKDRRAAGLMNLSWPEEIHFENYREVVTARDFMVLRSFRNSTVITVLSILILIIVCSLAGYILQRRSGKSVTVINFLFLSGLMLPPAILPTIWVLNIIGIYRSLFSMVMIEVALRIPFTVMLYRGFVASIPREIEEAAIIDGTNSSKLFSTIIMPLLKPVTATVIILNAVRIFNDFENPLYFLPGAKNATVQLTLYNFMGQYASSWNLLFADVVIITIPILILFIFFNKRIVAGMTAGAIKG